MVLWAVHEAVSTVTLNPDPGNLPGEPCSSSSPTASAGGR